MSLRARLSESSHDRRCARGGLLVGPPSRIPEDPVERWTPALYETIGCSQLRCERCGAVVRSDLANPPNRLYLCRCMNALEAGARALDADASGDDPALPWRCDGHPPQSVPFTLDGVRIDATTDFDALARKNFGGWAPPGATPYEQQTRGAWLNRLEGRLHGHPVGDALDRAAIALLDPANPALFGEALDFLMRAPSDAAARRILALWDDEKDGRLKAMHPAAKQGESFAAYVAIAIGRLARRGIDVGDRLREAAVRPAGSTILADVAALDGEWAAKNAADIARGGAVRRPIDVLFPLHAEAPDLAAIGLRKLAADGLVTRAEAADFARSLLPTNAALRADLGLQ